MRRWPHLFFGGLTDFGMRPAAPSKHSTTRVPPRFMGGVRNLPGADFLAGAFFLTIGLAAALAATTMTFLPGLLGLIMFGGFRAIHGQPFGGAGAGGGVGGFSAPAPSKFLRSVTQETYMVKSTSLLCV